MDLSQSEPGLCLDTRCGIFFISYALLICDSFFDVTYVLQPTKENADRLCNWYKRILTPSLAPLPNPGYVFPPYVVYKLIFESPNVYHWAVFLLWTPLAYRYWRMFRNSEKLQYWWSVICIRIVMAVVLALNIQGSTCQFHQNVLRFLGFTPTVLNGLSF